MQILIAGAGSVGRSIGRELVKGGHSVTIIDKKPEAMRVASIPEADWVLGDACQIEVLQESGIDDVDAVVATTGDDKANLVFCLLSKTEFGVPRVISRVSNPANTWLFDDKWGVDVAVSTPQIMSEIIEEAISSGKLVRRILFPSGAALYHGTIHESAPLAGQVLAAVSLPPDVVISSIVRDGVPLAASPDLKLDANDQVLFLVGAEADSQELQGLIEAQA